MIVVVVVSKKDETATMKVQTGASRENLHNDQPSSCTTNSTTATSSNRGQKFFAGLTPHETQEVIWYLMNATELKLVAAKKAKLTDNYIYSIEDYLPSKADVINYLDGRTRKPPMRQARVIIFNGSNKKIVELLVSPIPKPRNRKLFHLNRPTSKNLTWLSRPICNVVEVGVIQNFVINELANIDTIYTKSFMPDRKNCADLKECVYMNIAVRKSLKAPNTRTLITWFFVPPTMVADYYMYALPFYLIISATNTTEFYKIDKVYYNGHEFDSISELNNKYYHPDKTNPANNIEYTLPSLDASREAYGSPKYIKRGDSLDQTRRPPQQYYPDGQRFKVSGTHVDWLGWTFDIHPQTITGMQIFDVRYNKERIAYELSMQDILVSYSGVAPDDYFKHYFDNGWSIGRYNMPLVRGIDCPANAVYLNSFVYGVSLDQGLVLNDSICVFEHSNSIPLRRHYSTDFFTAGYRYAFSMPDSVLIVRQILTVWNYDYVFDYEFHQNGVIELKVSSSGYIAVTTNLGSKNSRFGYIINPDWNAAGNLHHHLFNFKLDLDVVDKNNNFKEINLVSSEKSSEYAGAKRWNQMTMDETEIKKEKDALFQYDFDKPKFYVMYNKNKRSYVNTGSSLPRGYRIQSNSFSKVVVPEDSEMINSGASWTKYQLAVSKYNENERSTASHFVQGDPFNPAINFDDFFKNDESLENTDLVAWATVGLYHAPTYEDLPVTSTPGKTLTVRLMPFNYFKRDPSIHSRDAAIFWGKSFNTTDDYLHVNDTCMPKNIKPYLHA